MSTETKQLQPAAKAVPTNPEVEITRINRAFWLSVIGLGLAAALVLALLIAGWKVSSDIVAVVGLFTSVLGTLVGAFFGLQIGSAGKEKAEDRADTAQKKADALQSAATPEMITKAMDFYPDLFKK